MSDIKSKSELKRLNVAQGRDIAEGVDEFGKSERSKPSEVWMYIPHEEDIHPDIFPVRQDTKIGPHGQCFLNRLSGVWMRYREERRYIESSAFEKLKIQLSETESELQAEKVWHGHWKATDQALDELRGKYRNLERELAEVKSDYMELREVHEYRCDAYSKIQAERDTLKASIETINAGYAPAIGAQAENQLLREDWVKMKERVLSLIDAKYFQMGKEYLAAEEKQLFIADLKYKGE